MSRCFATLDLLSKGNLKGHHMKYSYHILGSITALAMAGTIQAQLSVISQWTFEGDVLTPSTGSGTASYVGGTSGTFAAGNGSLKAWNTCSYPAQGTSSGTAGVEFNVSTVGFKNIEFKYDHRASETASRWAEVRYTLDGSTWLTWGNNSGGTTPQDTFKSFTLDLSSVSGANNNANFGLRILSTFSPVAFSDGLGNDFLADTGYHRSRDTGGSAYGTSGTWRFDNVTISGTPIPEPHEYALLAGLGLVGLALWRRRAAP